MSNIITLSSDEESSPPPRKKIKPTFLSSTIRITKVTTLATTSESPSKQSINEILASSNIGNSITITPVVKNGKVANKSRNIVKNKSNNLSKNLDKNPENILILSDEDENDVATEPCTSGKSHDENKGVSTIILDEENTSESKGDCESDDDCLIVNENDTKAPAEVSTETEAKQPNPLVEELKPNSFKIDNLPPKTDYNSNSFEIVELSEVDDTSEVVQTEVTNCTSIIKNKTETEHCDKIGTKSEPYLTTTLLDMNCTVVVDKDEFIENAVKAIADENESSSDLREEGDATTDLTGTNNSSDGEGCSSNKENNLEEERPTKVSSQADTAKTPETVLIDKYLAVCAKSVKGSPYEQKMQEKFESLRNNYKKCGAENRLQFQKMLEDNIIKADKSPASAVMSFKEVYLLVKELGDVGTIEVSKERKRNLKKLEKTMKLLCKKIKQLEEAEIDFEKEEDSQYIQQARYSERLHKVYQKYCSLLKKNPYSGRLTHAKLDFVDSEYNEINRAISKKFKNNAKFPSYMEMQNFIKKVSMEQNLNFSEQKIISESIHCFRKLGELLQNRRKKEFYEDHYLIVGDTEDPAAKNPSLNAKLLESHKEGLKKIEKVCEEFVIKEEMGAEPDISEDDTSDKSDCVDSD